MVYVQVAPLTTAPHGATWLETHSLLAGGATVFQKHWWSFFHGVAKVAGKNQNIKKSTTCGSGELLRLQKQTRSLAKSVSAH